MIRFDYLHDPLPKVVDALRSLRVPRHLHAVAAACATCVCAVAAASGIEVLHEHAAQVLERRAESRFEQSRAALSGARLEWRQLDGLIAQDRRLRDIRLSGSAVATRIAKTGNAFPRGAWLTSMTTAPASYALDGYANDLLALETVLSNLLKDPAVGQPQNIRMSRDERGRAGLVAFEIRRDAAP
ncbi:MAG: PilN domain-containing protein [Candidatus Tumulicola sp.]